jgi:hypothetical protein
MISHWPAILGGLGLLFWAGASQAASVPPAIAAEGTGIVEKVHGTHRSCRYSRAFGLHRHVGRYNRAVSCDSYSYDYYDEPFYFGPFLFFEPYGYRERRIAPRFRERRVVPRFRDGRQFDGSRFERFRPHRDGSRRRR